jgi:DNA-binding CsgD family transcriptional regulator
MKPLAHWFLEAITGAESWPSALAGMADSFGAIESHFTVWDRAQGRVLFSARAGRFPAEANERYARYFHKVDTCREALIWSGMGEIMLTQTYYGESFVNTKIYHDFLRPLGARYVMGVKLADCGHAVSMLRIHRSAKNGPYSEEDVGRLGRLFPSLARSAQLYFAQLQLSRAAAAATAALDQLRIGVIVMERRGRILHMNAAADRILSSDGFAKVRSGRLEFGSRNAQRALSSLVDRSPGSCGSQPIHVGEYVMSASPLEGFDTPASYGALLVTLRRSEPEPQDRMAKLRMEFGLTRSEAAISDQIASGRTLRQIAGLNSVSLNTVKTHLKAIFTKTNMRSQSDLVRVVLGCHSVDNGTGPD